MYPLDGRYFRVDTHGGVEQLARLVARVLSSNLFWMRANQGPSKNPGNQRGLSRPQIQRSQSEVSRASLISPTSSIEGDDENSSLTSSGFYMEGRLRQRASTSLEAYHDDQDSRPTSSKELAGWYSYGWAAEVFVICAMASFLPVTLEQLARDQGVQLLDKSQPCSSSWDANAVAHHNVSDHISRNSSVHPPSGQPACVVYILGAEINTASFAMYTFSASVLIQTLIIISMSGAADHGHSRKSFLIAFAVTGAVSTMLFLLVTPKIYLLGAFLAVVANTCFGASFVLLNSFLPLLVRHHPRVLYAQRSPKIASSEPEPAGAGASILSGGAAMREGDHGPGSSYTSSSTPLVRENRDHIVPITRSPATTPPELELSTMISSKGIGIGYIAGLLVQSVAIVVVVCTGSTTFSLRLVLFIIGCWWLVFTIPAALWLRPRPGPPLPSQYQTWLSYLIYAWKSLYVTLARARRLKDVVIFLCAWFLLSDGIATVSGTAILFAKTTLGMKPWALGLINVISTIAGVFGAFSWSYFSRLLNLGPSQTIVACICLFEIIPLYGLLGFIPSIRRLGVFGLQEPWEMYPLGAIYGFVLGGLSSYCRSFFSELIPPGSEAAFYALYAITDKGSSVFGPAIVGAITGHYGEIRPAFVFLAILIALPLPLMLLVNVERGKRDAMEMSKVFEVKNLSRDSQRVEGYRAIPTIVPPGEDGE